MAYTQKQIDKFNRQKYISELEKISKNLFRMLRDENVSSEKFMIKFEELKKKFDEKAEVQLDSEYHQQLKAYIERLYCSSCVAEEFNDESFNNMRDAEMSNLNRLQKLKNGTSYKKDKHRSKHKNEDWG
ncbi:MAG: hypothetical protein P794_01925 [Epsilonproteobacteria bacterium (ex Lamellibrachia satsuma)]|nr:MAG: hypothetical protein P794_01925 [Epsilonproteobacteria bacterium (ex Lamellibrachia satsuma)]